MITEEKIASILSAAAPGIPIGLEFVKNPGNSAYFAIGIASDSAIHFADNGPLMDETRWLVDFYYPPSFDAESIRKSIRKALFQAGFTYPRIARIYEYELEVYHLIFEFSETHPSEV